MIVLDASALIAIIANEPAAPSPAAILATGPDRAIAAMSARQTLVAGPPAGSVSMAGGQAIRPSRLLPSPHKPLAAMPRG